MSSLIAPLFVGITVWLPGYYKNTKAPATETLGSIQEELQ